VAVKPFGDRGAGDGHVAAGAVVGVVGHHGGHSKQRCGRDRDTLGGA